jgi:ribosomal protein S27AE
MSLRSPSEIRRGKRSLKSDLGNPKDLPAHGVLDYKDQAEFAKPGLIVCPHCGTKHMAFRWKCVVCGYTFYKR